MNRRGFLQGMAGAFVAGAAAITGGRLASTRRGVTGGETPHIGTDPSSSLGGSTIHDPTFRELFAERMPYLEDLLRQSWNDEVRLRG